MDTDADTPEETSSGARQRLRTLFLVIALLLLAGEAGLIVGLYREAIWEAEQRVQAATRLLEQHIARTFQSAEYILTQTAELGRSCPMDALERDENAWKRLNEIRLGLPEQGTLWIIDTKGQARLGSLYFPLPPTEVRDRYYFFAHQQGRHDLVIGPLVTSKNRDIQAFHVSRRIDDASGAMVGVAAIGFDVPTFTDFYHNLGLGVRSNLTVSGLDGRIILRQPDAGRFVGAVVRDGPLGKLIQAGRTSGVLRVKSPLDQVERIRAFKVLPRFGVVVGAGIAVDDALSEWREAAGISLAGFMTLLLGLGWMARQTLAGLSREEALITGLKASLNQRTREAEERALEAREANESKTRFLAAASHDLRQPLQAAGMFAEALAARLEDSPHMAIIDKLRQSLEATQLLLTTLLDVSTLEAGHVEPQPTAFPLAPFLSNLADQLEMDAAQRKLSLRVVMTDAWVVSDPVLLERIVRNLLVNAFRYTKTGGVLLGCRRHRDDVAICVVDTGIGIPADKFDAIFDDFTRLADKGRGPDRGLGLGLSVVRRTAHLLGHPVKVHSVVGRGSCFQVVVPLAK
jgi:signal transduction histidine kinase